MEQAVGEALDHKKSTMWQPKQPNATPSFKLNTETVNKGYTDGPSQTLTNFKTIKFNNFCLLPGSKKVDNIDIYELI